MGDGNGGREPTADNVSLDQLPLHSTNLITVLDTSGSIKYKSPAAERLFGFDPEEMVGDQAVDYFHPEDRPDVLEAFRRVVGAETYMTEAVEYRHVRADGTYCWVESVSSSEPTPRGNYVVNSRDISDRKAREQELIRANRRLEEFASVLSHDLRNPLQVARGRLELLDGGEHVAVIDEAHDRMETLIDDLLTLAHDGETVTDPGCVDLSDVVEECWQTVRTDGATLAVDTDRAVRADRSRLRQLLANLIRNSVEHGSASPDSQARQDSVEHGSTGSRAGTDDVAGDGASVTVEVGTFADGFYVADDGPGIDPDRQERVFRMGNAGEDGGLGVGLSIVKQVSHAHNWELAVTDSADGGARFEFTGVGFPET